jgi:hypothetical protein
MATENEIRLKKEAKDIQSQIIELQKKSNELTEKESKQLDNLIKKREEYREKFSQLRQDQLNAYKSEESSIKSMGSLYGDLKNQQKESLSLASNMGNLSEEQTKKITKIQEINRSIAELGPDQEASRVALMNQYNDEMKSLGQIEDKNGNKIHGNKKIVQQLKAQNSLANEYAEISTEQKDLIQKQHNLLDGVRNTIQGTLMTAQTLYGNLTGAIGGLVTGMGFVVDKIGQANSQLGATFFQTDGIARRAGVLSFFFDDAVASAQELTKQFGDTGKATFIAQAQVGLMAQNLGISGTEAASLVGSFARMNGGSTDIAADMVATSKEFAKQNGIIPSALMSDLAGSAEQFALFGEEGGKNILEAAGYAQKLGVSMSTISGITESLLDFESSVSKELELSAMLGRNINLSKARELAFNNDIEGATKETLKQLGGIEEFERMNYYQRKASADMLGVSVAELQRMVANQENAANISGVINEKFSMMGEIINGGLNKYLGTSTKALGGMITASGQLGMGFKSLGIDMGGMVKSTGQVLKNIIKMGASKVFTGGGATAEPGKLSKFKDKLFAGVGDTDNKPGGKPGKGMKGMGKGIKSIAGGLASFANPATLIGLAAVTAAIIGIGFAFRIAAPGIKAFGEAIGEVVKSVGTAVATVFGGLGDFFSKLAAVATPKLALSVMGLALGFGLLTATLSSFALAGLAAVPAMAAISLFSKVTGMDAMEISGGEAGSMSEYESGMMTKMDSMITELQSIKEAYLSNKDVYMDSVKVTNQVSRTSERSSQNVFGLGAA